MAEIAAAGNELLRVDRVEVDAAKADGRPSYTVETLKALGRRDRHDELVLLMGADVAAHLEEWHEPERVVELARVGIAARPGSDLDEAQAALERLGAADRAELIRMPLIDVSSTRIRRRVADGLPVRYLVPDGVLELIEAGGLYS